MNNEPILWTDGLGNYWHEKAGHHTIPLYTHPAKTLTDLEIDFVAKEIDDKEEQGDSFDFWYREFARAILRKAQEK